METAKIAIISICAFIVFCGAIGLCGCLYSIEQKGKAKRNINKIKEREAQKVRNEY